MTEIIISAILTLLFYIAFNVVIYKSLVIAIKPKSKLEAILAIIYLHTLFLSFIGFNKNSSPYYKAIDPFVDSCYSPISGEFILPMGLFLIIYLISLFSVWKYGKSLPPLSFVIANSFILFGNIINVLLILQVSNHDNSKFINLCDCISFLMFAPIGSLIVSILLTIKTFKESFGELNKKRYKNKLLNDLNSFLYYSDMLPLWIFISILPIISIILFILILFGHEPEYITKVFTDTATWRFSQQIHPPFLDHHGHYLCTVAAKGNPQIVKPIDIGIRRGRLLVVNRQLKVANAFEEMIQVFTPQLHRVIRNIYDKYGYNISTKINNERMSNLTYILMKPLEYFFIICLYLFWKEPEKLISKQYKISTL